ncbi:MAG: sigma-70 family RNA polymerase sigma factor, partial [Desulfatiglandaceae bacterium]
ERLVDLAKEGGRNALEELVRTIQDRIYGLALRILFLPADAEDATQEILIKIITHLRSFKGESRFTTWCFRIAANHLLSTRKRIPGFKNWENRSGLLFFSRATPTMQHRRPLSKQSEAGSGLILCRQCRCCFIHIE